MRDAIISAMGTDYPAIAEMAADESYRIEEVPVAALPDWDVIDLTLDHPNGPQGTTIAVSEDGRGVVLLGSPENFAEIAKDAQVESAEQAVELVQAFLRTTGDQSQPSYPVSSVDDIKFIPRPDADQSAQIDGIRKDHRTTIAAPSATTMGDEWTVVVWWVTEQQLIKHEVVVDAASGVTDSATVVADRMPTPVSP